MLILTTKQMKRAEELTNQSGLSYMDMMRNAGIMAFNYCNEKLDIVNKNSVILCGNGNNAGDGFVLANELCKKGSNVSVIMCCSTPRTEDSITAFKALQENCIDIIETINFDELEDKIDGADIIIDAIYGTGFHGQLSDEICSIIEYANESKGTKIALDIPSGINANTGDFGNVCFNADITITFAALKPAHVDLKSKEKCGDVEVVEIGITNDILYKSYNDVILLTQEMISSIIPKRKSDSHKGNYGKLLNISGSRTMGGAAMMSTLAALRIGAGTTTLASTSSVAGMFVSSLMEAMTLPLEETAEGSMSIKSINEIDNRMKKSTTILIGCGLSVTQDTKQIVKCVIENTNCSVVIDADALNCLSADVGLLKKLKCSAIITPHIGEMARLTAKTIEEIQQDPNNAARLFAKEYNVVVVLKGYNTIIATPKGDIYQNTTGNAGLAKGGSGDVLAGMIAGFLAQGMDAENAAICGVYLHGKSADSVALRMSQYSMLARDIIEEIPFVLKAMDR